MDARKRRGARLGRRPAQFNDTRRSARGRRGPGRPRGRDSAAALRGTQPSGTGVRVQLEAAPFDTLVTWIATLDQRYGLSIDSITVDRAARPGVVNANITFAATRR